MGKSLFVNVNIEQDRYFIVYDGNIKYDKPNGGSTYVAKTNYKVREGKNNTKKTYYLDVIDSRYDGKYAYHSCLEQCCIE